MTRTFALALVLSLGGLLGAGNLAAVEPAPARQAGIAPAKHHKHHHKAAGHHHAKHHAAKS